LAAGVRVFETKRKEVFSRKMLFALQIRSHLKRARRTLADRVKHRALVQTKIMNYRALEEKKQFLEESIYNER
jgi:hypothetical protein